MSKNEMIPDPQPPMFGTLLASRPLRSAAGTARSTVLAVVVHAALIGVLIRATMAVGSEIIEEEQITFIEIPPETPPLPPPPPPQAAPERVDVPIPVARGFQTLTMPEIVPPDIPPPAVGVAIREADFSGRGAEGGRADGKEGAPPRDDLSLAPTFTPYTVKPELRNAAEIARALQRNYPPLLRDAGIGGRTLMWFFIDETGKVVRTQVNESSGYEQLDEAAAKVAGIMRFSPALNRDKTVPVWVAIPITFTSR